MRDLCPRAAPLPSTTRSDASHAPAVERPLCRDDNRGRLRLQPLARSCGHALARGRHARLLGDLRFPARRAERRRLVGRISSRAASSRTATKWPFPRTAPRFIAARRSAHDHARGAGFARRRCRGPPRLGLESRLARPGDRADVIRGSRAGAAGRRRGAPGVFQSVRPDGIRSDRRALLATRRPRSPSEPRVWAAHVVVVEGESRGRAAVRDRPGPVSGPRPRHPSRRFP